MDDDRAASRDDAAANQAEAQRDALLDLLGILAHDLSNPLQSVTVLCELGVDDSTPGSEEQLRFRQCLEASDRMRGLIHGFGAIARRGRAGSTLHSIVGHVQTLLARRFERHRMAFSAELEQHGDQFVPPDFELAILSLLMAFIAGAEQGGIDGSECTLRTSQTAAELRVHVEATGASADKSTVIRLPQLHLERVAGAVSGAPIEFAVSNGRATLSFATRSST